MELSLEDLERRLGTGAWPHEPGGDRHARTRLPGRSARGTWLSASRSGDHLLIRPEDEGALAVQAGREGVDWSALEDAARRRARLATPTHGEAPPMLLLSTPELALVAGVPGHWTLAVCAGSLLCHGALIARGRGLAAIFELGGAAEAYRHGELLRVDARGAFERLDPSSSKAVVPGP